MSGVDGGLQPMHQLGLASVEHSRRGPMQRDRDSGPVLVLL